MMRITMRPSGTKYFRPTRFTPPSVLFWNVYTSPSAYALSF